MTTTIEELQIIPSGGIVTGSGNGTDVTPWIDTSYLVTPATNSHLSDLAGRVLSSKSMRYAKAAFEALRELLASAEKEKETPDEDMPMDMADGFYFVDLGLTPGQRFAGFALGKFVDMHGRAVEFTKESIDKFLSNTIKAIAAAKGQQCTSILIPKGMTRAKRLDGLLTPNWAKSRIAWVVLSRLSTLPPNGQAWGLDCYQKDSNQLFPYC